MKPEDQVCSLDLARKLKELGVKQDAYFQWLRGYHLDPISKEQCNGQTWELNTHLRDFSVVESLSAFTVAELGEMLPGEISIGLVQGCGLTFMKIGNDWSLFTPQGFIIRDSSEADARAKMLIYLLENKLLPADEPSKKL